MLRRRQVRAALNSQNPTSGSHTCACKHPSRHARPRRPPTECHAARRTSFTPIPSFLPASGYSGHTSQPSNLRSVYPSCCPRPKEDSPCSASDSSGGRALPAHWGWADAAG